MSLRLQLAQTLSNLATEATTGWGVEMGLTVLGIVIGIVSLAGLISLWPSVAVTPLAPIDPKQPFSVPFKITNSGYLPIRYLQIYCFAHSVKVGGLSVSDSLSSNKGWNAEHLGRGESVSIITNFVRAPMLPAEADIAIVVDYKPFGMPFTQQRSICRFVGQFGENWQWLQQASKPMKKTIDASIGYWANRGVGKN